jgi:acetoin utilization deacetylase AcuC-like enzyme
MEPEAPARLEAIHAMIERSDIKEKLVEIAPRYADAAEIGLFHEPAYIDRIAQTAGKARCALDPDTETTEESYDTARLAVGGVLNAVDSVLAGSCDNAFALVRPPGHHAAADHAAGFCIFNNVAVGALYALTRRRLSRILICDWDMHHGDGTQGAFYADHRVLYFSTHEFPAYPGTGRVEELGRGSGTGYTINVPLAAGAGDGDFLAAFGKVLEPVALHFRPELILVSAGFDIHHRDPLGGMQATEQGFAALTRLIMNIADACCGGKLVVVLEGGYNLGALAASVKAVLRELLDETRVSSADMDDLKRNAAESTEAVIRRARQHISPYWPVF